MRSRYEIADGFVRNRHLPHTEVSVRKAVPPYGQRYELAVEILDHERKSRIPVFPTDSYKLAKSVQHRLQVGDAIRL